MQLRQNQDADAFAQIQSINVGQGTCLDKKSRSQSRLYLDCCWAIGKRYGPLSEADWTVALV